MKILLIGHSIIDHIEIDNNIITKPGGIFYSVAGLLYIKNPADSIYLLTGINKSYYNLFENIYSKINTNYFVELEKMPEVILRIYEDREREETYKNISMQLPIDKIDDWTIFDGVLINMITGFDITSDLLSSIRSKFNGLIYFDVHTLSRGIDENMKREFRPIPDIEKWLQNIDILQCNENELMTIFINNDVDVKIKKIFEYKVKAVVVTKGGKGAELFYKKNNRIERYYLPAKNVVVVNKIGCGDIFGAVFFYSYLRSNNIIKSLEKANEIAAISVSKDILTEINN